MDLATCRVNLGSGSDFACILEKPETATSAAMYRKELKSNIWHCNPSSLVGSDAQCLKISGAWPAEFSDGSSHCCKRGGGAWMPSNGR